MIKYYFCHQCPYSILSSSSARLGEACYWTYYEDGVEKDPSACEKCGEKFPCSLEEAQQQSKEA